MMAVLVAIHPTPEEIAITPSPLRLDANKFHYHELVVAVSLIWFRAFFSGIEPSD